MSKARDLADFISTGSILSDGTIESTEISGVTATANEINTLDGITATTEELNNVAGVNSDVQTQLDGKQAIVAGVSDAEIGYLDGVTSNLQTQLDNISVTSGSLTKSFASGETASITLAQAISPAPVVSVTKEVAQAGQSSKGAWDVNASASNYELHNTAYDTTLTASSVVSDIEDGTLTDTFNTESDLDNNINSFFNNDGTRLYVYGYAPRNMSSYYLSTPYDISTRGSELQSVTISNFGGGGSFGPRWNNDGTKLYFPELNGYIYELAVSTAYDLSTIAASSTSTLNLSSYTTGQLAGIVFKPDGTRLWAINDVSPLAIAIECTLSTAWDLSTASFTAQHTLDAPATAIAFADSGSSMYVLDRNADLIYKFNLSTAYDLSTFDFAGSQDNINLGSGVGDPCNITIDNDDKVLLVANYGNHNTYQYSATVTNSVTLGTGSFASTDVGKRIQGNGGDVTLTSTAGAFSTTGGSAFTDSSTIASGSWTMRGLKSVGDADGIGLTGIATTSFSFGTYTKSHNVTSPADTPINLAANSNGTKWFVFNQNGTEIFEFLASTPGDITTLSYTMSHNVSTSWVTSSPSALTAAGDGSRFYMTGSTGGYVYVATTGNGSVNGIGSWDGYEIIPNTDTSSSIQWKPDGSKLYIKGVNAVSNPSPAGMTYSGTGCYIYAYDVPTAWDVTSISNALNNATSTFFPRENQYSPFVLTDNGTHVVIGNYNDSTYYVYRLNTAWDITSVDYSTEIIHDNSNQNTDNSSTEGAIGMTYVNDKLYTISYNIKKITEWPWGATSSYSQPTSQYHIGVTNSGGQIDSSTWLDINSMTADQAAGDGTVHYAVSTDDRTTWSVAKASDGVRPIVRDNAGTWQYNTAASTSYYGLADASYDNKSKTTGVQSIRETHFNTTGTKMYVISDSSDRIFEFDLSTAFDVSTATYNSANFLVGGQLGGVQGFCFNNDGTKVYAVGETNDTVYQYSLSTAFDITTASYDSISLSIGGQQAIAGTIVFNDDGTKLFLCGESEDYVRQYTLTTAYNVGTATAASGYLDHSTQTASVTGMAFNGDGTKLFLASRDSESVIYQYGLSTAYDVSTASYDNISFDVASQLSATFQGIVFSNDGSKLYVTDNGGDVFQYSTESEDYLTSTTWTNATTNDEFYALQQALGATSSNRMDKTQLDAVADGSHFTLGDTLDLAIALRQDTASASTPKSDGVSINYDAQALNQGAVLGTDYDYDFPDSTTVRVTSNAAQNLKIRVV